MIRLISCVVAALIISSRAAIFTNFTGTLPDVQAVVNSTAPFDIVLIVGPVSNSWPTFLTIPHSLQLIGTNGTVDITRTNSGKIITSGQANMVRLSGLTFHHYGTSSSDSCYYTQGQGIYVDNCSFLSGNNVKKIAIFPDGINTTHSPNGCASQCFFFKTRVLCHVGGICHTPPGCFPAAQEWAAGDRRGTTNQWVLENCQFEQIQQTLHNSTDDEYGGCYTVRFSTFTNTTAEAHSNGSATTPQERAGRSVEIYGNTFVQKAPVTLGSPAMFIRGGTGGAFSNTIIGTWPSSTKVIKFDAERGFSGRGGSTPIDGNNPIDNHGTGTHTGANAASVLTDSTATWAASELVTGTGVSAFWVYNLTDGSRGQITANTTTTATATLTGGTRNNWNTGDSYKVTGGYPMRDQLGTLQDAFPWMVTNTPPTQTLSPLCYHANIINGNPAGIFIDPASAYWVVDGRDVTNSPPTWPLLVFPHPLVTFYGTNVPPPIIVTNPPIVIGGPVRLQGGVNLRSAP